MTISISTVIQDFIRKGEQLDWIHPIDRHYVANRLIQLVNLSEYAPDCQCETHALPDLLNSLDALRDYAVANGIIEDIGYAKEQFEAAVMDLITPTPSKLNDIFWEKYATDKTSATDYFYALSQANDYIKTRNIAKNIAFTTPSAYGDLEITINLSKPEKDPKEIAAAKLAPASNYPKCLLCMENEGYQGRSNHPARQNHRIVRLDLAGRAYGMQYSPYVYYNEHSIFLNELHIPMEVNRQCFDNLLAIVDVLPHYFAGSNADLPIVGGSILSHDHYQGGRHTFPMEKATAYQAIDLVNHPNVTAELVNWPMSVIRLRSANATDIAVAAEDILAKWRGYSDESADILAFTEETPHNTITPIARRKGEWFEMDLVLRNNRTTEEFPDGIFHPHKDVQHVKKENIGLIEVMGLAILPPRLVEETAAIERFLLGQADLDSVAEGHREWATALQTAHPEVSADNVHTLVQNAIGEKFARVLEDAGVYKQTVEGREAILRFVNYVNQ
ncbi:UDP-glucose--hexose-1-phosphate uridylyltransferase [Aerococcaceae bacterium NML130460]|nr:UDP-glucose--hexose-1-phosphate uridylyltransferase [Aerococcaceae bacterium NML130460]